MYAKMMMPNLKQQVMLRHSPCIAREQRLRAACGVYILKRGLDVDFRSLQNRS